MKKMVLFMLVLSLAMACCACAAQPEAAQGYMPMLAAEDGFSEELYQALEADWAAFGALSKEEQMLSSHSPGWCSRDFDDWEDAVRFVGMAIPNPLETLDELEKGTYVGMPVGYAGAPRFSVTWYGTREGHVEWVQIDSGYRSGKLRVCVSATLYADPPEDKSLEEGWSVEHQRLAWLEDSGDGEPVITWDSGEQYEARTATLAWGYVLYSIRVIGAPGTGEILTETLDEIVPYFEEIPAG